jgi:hypothetical protein
MLSKVYPLDSYGIQSLLEIPKEKSEELFRRAKDITYIKLIPGDFIKLHDEVERIVNQHLWTRISLN